MTSPSPFKDPPDRDSASSILDNILALLLCIFNDEEGSIFRILPSIASIGINKGFILDNLHSEKSHTSLSIKSLETRERSIFNNSNS